MEHITGECDLDLHPFIVFCSSGDGSGSSSLHKEAQSCLYPTSSSGGLMLVLGLPLGLLPFGHTRKTSPRRLPFKQDVRPSLLGSSQHSEHLPDHQIPSSIPTEEGAYLMYKTHVPMILFFEINFATKFKFYQASGGFEL